MILHVLPGDATVGTFELANIEGDVAVCRECLVEGDVSGGTLPEFWENRARYLAREYPDEARDYHETVVPEFAKLTALQPGSEVNLWFEYELFCQTNMWFCLSLLQTTDADIYRVAPATLGTDEIWNGFGRMNPDDLKTCFSKRVKFGRNDIELGSELWQAYRMGEHERLLELSETESMCFPYLKEVCAAEIEKGTRPKDILRQIKRDNTLEFGQVFKEFGSRAGVYGFGDSQVQRLLREI